MLANGDDPAKVTDEAFDRAIDRSRRRVDSGQIRRFTGNDYAQPLTRGDLAAAVAWSGDIVQLLARQPEAQVGVPKDGGMIWTDNMLIPTGGSVPTASTYMNFVYDPDRRPDRRLRQLRDAGQGREGGACEDRPEARGEHADLPGRRDALAQLHQYDSAALEQRDAHHEVAAVLGQ